MTPRPMQPKLTDDEIAYVKRPLTDDERAAIKGLPHPVAEGWVRRKRADEIVKRRQKQGLLDGLEALADAIREEL